MRAERAQYVGQDGVGDRRNDADGDLAEHLSAQLHRLLARVPEVELRRRNFGPADAFPYRSPAGAVYDAGNYQAAHDELLRIADYDARVRE